jgi:broad specificity phosphatase PhoE
VASDPLAEEDEEGAEPRVTGRVLYLIRHGQSDFDWAGDRWASARGDQWNPPLSEKGREQAALLTKRLLVMDLAPFVV